MNSDHKLIFDTETSGLPSRSHSSHYTNLDQYSTCRLLSISWIILNNSNDIVLKNTYYIIPDNFDISTKSIEIHGLTKDILTEKGITIHNFVHHLNTILNTYNITHLIAHNINFDINVIKSELHRYAYLNTLDKINNKSLFCTMINSKKQIGLSKWPKLAEAYRHYYNDEITNAHDAEFDTLYCYKVFLKLYEYYSDLF